MLDEYVAVGEVVGPQGRVGEVRVNPLTDHPERFAKGLRLFKARPKQALESETLEVVDAWEHRPFVILKFDGIESIDAAERLRGYHLYVPIDEVFPLPDGSYYVFQLIGLSVVGEDDQEIGTLVEVITGPANDVYVVESGESGDGRGKRYLIPATKEIVKQIDLSSSRMVIAPLPGLLE